MTAPINSANLQNLIKQPPPSTMEVNSGASTAEGQKSETNEAPIRKYNRPNVGVVTPANLSQTPFADSLEIRRQENPQQKYKYIPTPKVKGNFQKIVSAGTFLTGIFALLSVLGKNKTN